MNWKKRNEKEKKIKERRKRKWEKNIHSHEHQWKNLIFFKWLQKRDSTCSLTPQIQIWFYQCLISSSLKTYCNTSLNLPSFSIEELQKLLALFLAMGLNHQPKVKHYWKHPDTSSPLGSSFFSVRMPHYKFAEFVQCLDFNLDWILNQLQTNAQSIWNPYQKVVVDESMVPCQHQKNPHHVFIVRKPHPHGVKIWTHFFTIGYLYAWSLYKRDQGKERVEDTVEKMIQHLESQKKRRASHHHRFILWWDSCSWKNRETWFSCCNVL